MNIANKLFASKFNVPAPIVIETIKQIRATLEEKGLTDTGLEHIADRVRRLVAHSDEIVVPESAEDSGQNQRKLRPIYIDDGGLVLAQGIVVPEQPTPIHSHGIWGIIGVYRGRDRYQIWRRNGDGDGLDPPTFNWSKNLSSNLAMLS